MYIWRPRVQTASASASGRPFFFIWVMLLSLAPLPAFAKTVFLVCDGQFETSTAINGPVETEQFDGSLYLSVEADDFAVRRVKLLPFERSTRLAAIELTPHPGSTDDGRVTQFTATEDALIIEQTESHGKMVNALVDDDPLALTPESLHVMHLRLNRFSGYIAISWQDHQVREVKPEGALRSVKKRYSNSKSFAADCSTMKQRIF